MAKIFISYRRGDSIGHTGRLFDLLSKHFGNAQIFMDIDTIGPGEDYAEVIKKTCESCEVLLAVIGRSWLDAIDQDGNRRLDDPGDFVRLEIVHVLEKGVRVVPVLVDGARMPDAKSLPPDLKNLLFAMRGKSMTRAFTMTSASSSKLFRRCNHHCNRYLHSRESNNHA